MLWPAVTLIAAMLVMAVYNFYSIRGRTNTLVWHLCQYALFVLIGLFGHIIIYPFTSWHVFGEFAATVGLGVFVYVFALHYLLRRF